MILMAIINLSDLRWTSASFSYNSFFALFVFAVCLLFPFFMVYLYNKKIVRTTPLPDMKKNMSEEAIKKIYQTTDAEWI